MRKVVFTLFGLVLFAAASPGPACMMMPMSFNGDVDQGQQQVVIIHHNGQQQLILRVNPFFTSELLNENGELALPEYFEWVVTVPTRPDAYRIADAKIFKDAAALATEVAHIADEHREEADRANQGLFRWLLPASSKKGDKSAVKSESLSAYVDLSISDSINVGDYTIREIEALGPQALEQLNAYLKENNYPTEDPEHMRWFVENDFTFLCMRIKLTQSTILPKQSVDLQPLQISFPSRHLYYPGMFSSQQGNFTLQLRTISSLPLLNDSLHQVREKLMGYNRVRYTNLWIANGLPESLEDAATFAEQEAPARWFVNTVDSIGFNESDEEGVPAIAGWSSDVFFRLGGFDDLPPKWYYGDVSKGTRFSDVGGRTQRVGVRYADAALIQLGILFSLGILVFFGVGHFRRKRRAASAA